jgi:large subunit ribosomal protein L3
MLNTLLGIKKGMVSSYDARGRRVGATVVFIDPNIVTQVKTTEGKDGYNGIQVGMGQRKSLKKPQIGHLKKIGVEKNLRFFREIRTDEVEGLSAGQEVLVGDVFRTGDAVKVTGVSKGRGFQGGVKRYNFAGGPKTHGQSDRHRAPGSIGSGTTPGRVYKGKHMAGHMGVEQVSYKGLEVIAVDRANNLLTIKGGVPGPIGGLVIIQKQGQIKGYTPPPEEKPDEEEEVAQKDSEEQNSSEPENSAPAEDKQAEGGQENA